MGYVTRRRTRKILCDLPELEPADGSDQLCAEVVANLTFEELELIPSPIYRDGEQLMYSHTPELREALAPYVVSWNCTAINRETGLEEPVPPPAEAGPQIFRVVDTLVAVWIGMRLKTGLVTANEKKAAMPPSESTEPTPPGTSSNSRGRRRKSQPPPMD